MNFSTAVLLINKAARAIAVSYEPEKEHYTFKTLNPDIKAGDYVVIPTNSRHMMTVAKVEAVDVDVNFDDNAIQLKWIIATVDRADHDRVLKLEEHAIARIKSADVRRKREELADKLLKDNPDLGGLEIAGATNQIAAPTT